jgi:hypothetical protein
MNVVVPTLVALSICISFRVLAHSPVFYVDTAPGAAFPQSPLLDG